MKKDILFLCQYFYPEYNSSATLPYDTALKLVQNGKSVGVLTGYPHEYALVQNIPKKETHRQISIHRIQYFKLNKATKLGRMVKFLSFTAAAFCRLFHFRHYQHIIVYSNPPILPLVAIVAKKLFGCKLIFVCYDIYPEVAIQTNMLKETSLVAKFMGFVNRQLFKNVSKVVALSSEMKEFILKNRCDVKENQIVVIPNWYENTPLHTIEKENEALLQLRKHFKFVVSYLGNMGTAQDIHTILQAAENCQDEDICFVFAGHGNKVDKIQTFIEKNKKENVFLFGFLHGDDYKTALKISDVFLTSLQSGLSGLCVPSKTYAYMMAGKPVVSIMDKGCDISQILEKNHAGISVENGDYGKILNYLSFLKNDTEAFYKASCASREIFLQNYSTEIGASLYQNLFEK